MPVMLAHPYRRRPMTLDHGDCPVCGRPRKGDSSTCSSTCAENKRERLARAINAAKLRRTTKRTA